jgi:hypothetical protein
VVFVRIEVIWLTCSPIGITERCSIAPQPHTISLRVAQSNPRIATACRSLNSCILLGAMYACKVTTTGKTLGARVHPADACGKVRVRVRVRGCSSSTSHGGHEPRSLITAIGCETHAHGRTRRGCRCRCRGATARRANLVATALATAIICTRIQVQMTSKCIMRR